MNKEIQLESKLETSRLILLAGEQVFSYKETIKDEMLNSVDTLKDWVAFFNYQFDEYKVTDYLNKSTDTQYNKEYFRYFIFEKDTMQFVGSVVLQDIDLRLPSCEIGYWAVKIVTGVPEAIPVIGSPLVELLRGSASVGQSTLTRFYSLHTFVLPLLTAVFMLMHFPMIRKQGISGPL